MARRKKPQIKGTDPSYDHSFERFRPIPNDMPPEVTVPGVKKPETNTLPEEPQKKPDRSETPKPTPAATSPKPVAAPRKSAAASKSKIKPTPKPMETTKTNETQPTERQTTLDAAVTIDQSKRIAAFEAKGLKMKDIVTLAGRRATERFTLSPQYVPKPDADRLPMKQGYHTSKRLPANLLDTMRKEQDPLGISSDPAMVRGQFELLFWTCLDEVIEELKARY